MSADKTKRGGRLYALSLGALLSVLLLGGIVCAVCVGKYRVTPPECLKILFQQLLGLPGTFPKMTVNVVMELRVPRVFASVLVGAALSLSGAAYQGVFGNPLISPDFLGVSGGACIGAAEMPISILTGLMGAPFYAWLLWRQRRRGA